MMYKKKPIKWNGKNHREMWNFLIGKTDDYISSSGDNFYIDKCLICSRRHTMDCPNSSKCFSLENKPYFKEG